MHVKANFERSKLNFAAAVAGRNAANHAAQQLLQGHVLNAGPCGQRREVRLVCQLVAPSASNNALEPNCVAVLF